jgi:periplasmic divalent cation tolerance protein
MPECKEEDVCVVTTTVASLEDARILARRVVEERLAACAQVEPIAASFYVWDGRLCEEPEVRVTIKTTGARLAALQALFSREHPYELPQFTAVRCDASPEYAGWVLAAVKD